MTVSVRAFLDRVRERGVELPPQLTSALLFAAVRLSESRAIAIRPELLLVDADGGLELRDGAVDAESAYASPELRSGAVLANDARAMVYAAGALGYELSTLKTLAPDAEAGPEIQGRLAPIIRKALAQDRQKRWRDLDQMARAIELAQPPPPPEEERLILAAVAQTTERKKRLAKIAVKKDLAPAAQPVAAPADVFLQPPEGEEPGVVELHEAQVVEARTPEAAPPAVDDSLRADLAALQSTVERLAKLVPRVLELEEKIKVPPAPPAPAGPPLDIAREVALIIDSRLETIAHRTQRRPLFGALPLASGAIAGAAVAAIAVIALRPQPVVPAPVAVPAPAPQVAVTAVVPPSPPPKPVVVEQPPPPPKPDARVEPEVVNPPPVASVPAPRKRAPRKSPAAVEHAAEGDKALRAFNTSAALTAFETALKEDPSLPAAHRGLGMVYVLQGKNDAAKVEYEKYLQLAPDAPDADQIKRLLAR